MPQNIKPLVIEVKPASVPAGHRGEWKDITTQMPTFTGDIITPSIKEGADISAIVSGVPTIFARVNLFRLSIDYVANQKGGEQGSSLMQFYEQLVDEWKGFIACLAFDYQKITTRRIYLGYSDGKDIDTTSNIYEPKGAFGQMLFKRKALWCDQNKSKNETNLPFIDVISYDGRVVGATCPDSLLFTAVAYNINDVRPYVDVNTRRFTDPLKSGLSEAQANQLYKYVEHLLNKLDVFEATYQNLDVDIRPTYTTIRTSLVTWKNSIEDYIKSNHYKVQGSVPSVDCFKKPFDKLFNYSSELWGLEGSITEQQAKDAILFDPKKLLLPRGTEIARFIFAERLSKDKEEMKKLPVTMLRATVKDSDEYAYFALPLSAQGLNVFGGNVEALVGQEVRGNVINSSLKAIYDCSKDVDNLEVQLILRTDDSNRELPFNVVYTAKDTTIRNKDIMIWPNFISTQWNSYYLFSEIPHNAPTALCPYCATPFLGNLNDTYFRAMTDENNEPVYVAKDGKIIVQDQAHVELIVNSDSRVAANPYKYEVFKSDVPFRGVGLTVTGNLCGFLLFRFADQGDPSQHLPRKLPENHTFEQANVGIDFGSTNTSVAFFNTSSNRNPEGLELKNHVISMLSYTDPDRKTNFHVASEKDILFFPSKMVRSNSVKSILTLHDKQRLVKAADENDINYSLRKEVKGGFPCFEKNMPVGTIDDKHINLNFTNSGLGTISLVHNMKWSDSKEDIANKEAFLRTLMLQIYADLFEKGILPVKVKWSYPSSMGNSLLAQYRGIWDSLVNVNPVTGAQRLTISAPHFNDIGDNDDPFGTKDDDAFGDNPFGQQGDDSPFGTEAAFGNLNNMDNPFGGGNDPFGNNNANPFGGGNDSFASESATFGNTGANAFDTISNPFGNSERKTKIVDLKPDNGPINFGFVDVDQRYSMTEASAVATYMMATSQGPATPDMLTLCFDIGGSTTDISALCKMKTSQGIVTSMIKQNSIRFAAQRISQATKFSKGFKDVLLDICSRNNLFIDGLNRGQDKYSPSTASYYFDQIVDELDLMDDASEKMREFYRRIAVGSKELMSVNLYVTGLIMYYSGQLTRKIIEEVRRSDQRTVDNWKPLVNIAFAGKGARIFEWFWSTNPGNANKYYVMQFINGLGGQSVIANYLAHWPRLNIDNRDWREVKYEVSKGLSFEQKDIQHKLLVPKNDNAIEVLGEDGYFIVGADGKRVSLPFDNSVTSEMMENIGTYFQAPAEDGQMHCKKFIEFAGVFMQAAKGYFGQEFDIEVFKKGFKDMDMNSYISNLPDFRSARANNRGKFDFVAPIIILEGMKFYDEYLMKCFR
jgi:hypothetical protein